MISPAEAMVRARRALNLMLAIGRQDRIQGEMGGSSWGCDASTRVEDVWTGPALKGRIVLTPNMGRSVGYISSARVGANYHLHTGIQPDTVVA